MRRVAIALALISTPAFAQAWCPVTVNGLCAGPDGTPYATTAQVPQPATSAPGAEMVGGATGTDNKYALANHSHPRISRTGTCTLSASNTCTISWTTAFPASVTPVMLGDPVAINTAAAQPIDCDVTGAPTISGVPVKCWQAQGTLLSLSIVTTGLTLSPFTASSLSGVTVTAAAIPASN